MLRDPMTWLGYLNFTILQWFFVRRAAIVDSDGTPTGWTWLVGVVPLTGWWYEYRYVWRQR